jgi:outer membrane biosynthesis protein TonB
MIPEMSPDTKRSETKRPDGTAEAAHERARMLAAESVDAPLQPTDAAWLAGHLASCPDCAAADQEYRAIHGELHGLVMPEPPRDLWARTSAALDAVELSATRRSPGRAKATGAGSRPLLFTAAAVGVVVVVVAAALMQKSPVGTIGSLFTPSSLVAVGTAVASDRPSAAPQGPLAVVGGTRYWISSNAGIYEIKGGTSQCLAKDGSCSVAGGTGQTLGTIASDSAVSAAIAPNAARAAVWTTDKIAVVPLSTMPSTVSLDLLTPRPATAVPPTKEPTPTPAATPTPTPAATPTPTPAETSAPAHTSAVSPEPVRTAVPVRATQPTAILSGYEVVGRDPEFSADGTLLAFTARPVDHSTGPDVFIWRVGQERAEPVTSRHTDLLAGWYGRQILISEITAATASSANDADGFASYLFDPGTGKARQIDVPMLLPAVDPTGRYLIYWSGTVEFDPQSDLWQPGTGDLYFERWSDLTLTPASLAPGAAPTIPPSPTPSPTPAASAAETPPSSETPQPSYEAAQPAAPDATSAVPTDESRPQDPGQPLMPQSLPIATGPNQVHAWIVRWDASGSHVAVWVADRGSASVGRLSLYSIDRETGLVNTNEPLLSAGKVLDSISFDDGHLVYASAEDGKTYIRTLPAAPPATVSTPAPTAPGEVPTGVTTPESPAP